jgi:two-component system, chemotaxis family, sensor kinase CheA
MTVIDLNRYKDLYIETAKKYLADIDAALVQLNNQPDHADAIHTLHISFHSLKSQSLVMGYQKTGMLCKTLEDIFRRINEQHRGVSKELLDTVAVTLTHIKESLAHIEQASEEIDLSSDAIRLEKMIDLPIDV